MIQFTIRQINGEFLVIDDMGAEWARWPTLERAKEYCLNYGCVEPLVEL